jgi:hypothetical protein
MKQTKIFYGRDLIGRFACDGRKYTKFQIQMFYAKRAAKRTVTIAAIIVTAGWIMTAGIYYAKANIQPEIAWAKEIVVVPVTVIPPVMQRIAVCESNGKHFDPKTGQVYMLANTNKTVDVGKYMINTVWHKKAKELGFDITTEKGNEAMAYWIYQNIGTSPWSFSASCWSK